MGEKKTIEISLGTVICIFIIIILLVALGVTYYLGFVKDDNKVRNPEKDVVNTVGNNETNNVEETVNTIEENANVEKTPKLQLGKKYQYELPAKYGENGEIIEVGEGSSIIFKEDNTVEASTVAIPGGGSNYRGTYKVQGNKITVTLTQMYDIEWIDYGTEDNEFIYTIISDTQIKEGNNILEIAE